MKVKQRQVGLVLGFVLGAGVLSGVAAAGNPHGTPPGQANQQMSPSSSAGVKSSSGHATKQTSSATSTGVKPSSTTQHNTNAAAGSDKTKQYGNGKTAGQIAMNNGASADTNLYGPGNSQPHKVAVCSKNGKSHYVDVHALKAHRASSCTNGSTSTGATTSGAAASVSGAAVQGMHTARVSSAGKNIHTSHVSGAKASAGGVLGASHGTRSKRVAETSRPARAVVGAATFTG